MIQTKECPKCETEHRLHIKKCGCGYVFGSKQQATPDRDPMHGCCAYSTGTSRCHYPGTFSDSTSGGGEFYCAAHYHLDDPSTGAAIVYRSQEEYPRPDYSIADVRRRYELRTLKAIADHKGAKATRYHASTPGKDWAHRIMERQANGETLAIIAIDYAEQVVGVKAKEAA